MIHVEHLTRRFGATNAIEDLTFDLAAGEVVGFLGPNGAGKTTTMRILTGYLPATSGKVEIAGLDVLRDSLAVRRQIGYLPEAVPLYREHRVREMLEFQARLHGMSRKDYHKGIPEVLERVRIADRENSLVGSLSRGQRQRVGLAVALLPNPKVLILDEPTSGLDPLQRLEMRGLLRELASEHTVLLSSHILPEIEAVCARVIILNRGRIAADGTPEQLVRDQVHESAVRLEAVVGNDVETALRLLRAIRGVHAVEDRGRLGIHQRFELRCDEDLREDVGALAAQRGWALRELSWSRPTLETLFARIALELDPSGTPPATVAKVSDEASTHRPAPLIALEVAPASGPVAGARDAKATLPLG
ncbi:MAG TPA: ATP-binding cassette domain-containing protein, partial [Planctomycetota bacterium]|nr:ATP-binding cassette domain-containing protein [Planctomycetota bacterium]